MIINEVEYRARKHSYSQTYVLYQIINKDTLLLIINQLFILCLTLCITIHSENDVQQNDR